MAKFQKLASCCNPYKLFSEYFNFFPKEILDQDGKVIPFGKVKLKGK
jgi:hypothetical protein